MLLRLLTLLLLLLLLMVLDLLGWLVWLLGLSLEVVKYFKFMEMYFFDFIWEYYVKNLQGAYCFVIFDTSPHISIFDFLPQNRARLFKSLMCRYRTHNFVSVIILCFWKCNFPMNHNVCLFVFMSVGLSKKKIVRIFYMSKMLGKCSLLLLLLNGEGKTECFLFLTPF